MKYQISHQEAMTTQALRACQVANAAVYLVKRRAARLARLSRIIACLVALWVVIVIATSELIARGVIYVG